MGFIIRGRGTSLAYAYQETMTSAVLQDETILSPNEFSDSPPTFERERDDGRAVMLID